MNPLTCTFAPNIYTEWGFANFNNWVDSGFSNYKFTADGEVHKLITRLSIENILHPFQPWILGQKNYPTKFAIMSKIPLIVYGDNPAEYGNPHADLSDDMNMEWFSCKDPNKIFISGYPIEKLKKDLDLSNAQLEPYVPVTENEFRKHEFKICFIKLFYKLASSKKLLLYNRKF